MSYSNYTPESDMHLNNEEIDKQLEPVRRKVAARRAAIKTGIVIGIIALLLIGAVVFGILYFLQKNKADDGIYYSKTDMSQEIEDCTAVLVAHYTEADGSGAEYTCEMTGSDNDTLFYDIYKDGELFTTVTVTRIDPVVTDADGSTWSIEVGQNYDLNRDDNEDMIVLNEDTGYAEVLLYTGSAYEVDGNTAVIGDTSYTLTTSISDFYDLWLTNLNDDRYLEVVVGGYTESGSYTLEGFSYSADAGDYVRLDISDPARSSDNPAVATFVLDGKNCKLVAE